MDGEAQDDDTVFAHDDCARCRGLSDYSAASRSVDVNFQRLLMRDSSSIFEALTPEIRDQY